MPSEPCNRGDGRPQGRAIHATAVAIGRRGLLIVGPSHSGKSRLANALIAASTPRCLVRLVGDDRILIRNGLGGPIASPHPRIAGFIERRGLGIVATPFVAAVTVRGIVVLGPKTLAPDLGQNFPRLSLVNLREGSLADPAARVAKILVWFRGACTTPPGKPPAQGPGGAKD